MKMFKKNNFFMVITVIGLISLIPAFSKFEDLLLKNRKLRLNMKQVADENKMLLERQLRLQTDPVFAESVARKKLNVAKEGEVVYKILPEKD